MQAGTPFAQHGHRVVGKEMAESMRLKAETYVAQLAGGGSRVNAPLKNQKPPRHDDAIPPIPTVHTLSIAVLSAADAIARVRAEGADLSALWLQEHERKNGARPTVTTALRDAGYTD